MDDIQQFEGRITAALDRIRRGLEAVDAPRKGPDPADIARLEAALAEERTANAQLEERVKALKDRQDSRLARLEATVEEQKGRMAAVDRDLQALRQANAELREVTGQLRAAVAENVAEPELVNRAMQAELDALRAVRAADIAEVDAVMAELAPLIAPKEAN